MKRQRRLISPSKSLTIDISAIDQPGNQAKRLQIAELTCGVCIRSCNAVASLYRAGGCEHTVRNTRTVRRYTVRLNKSGVWPELRESQGRHQHRRIARPDGAGDRLVILVSTLMASTGSVRRNRSDVDGVIV